MVRPGRDAVGSSPTPFFPSLPPFPPSPRSLPQAKAEAEAGQGLGDDEDESKLLSALRFGWNAAFSLGGAQVRSDRPGSPI